MSILAILQLIFLVISNIPNMLSVVTDIIALIRKLQPNQQAAAFAKLQAAWADARAGRGFQSLSDLHDWLELCLANKQPQ